LDDYVVNVFEGFRLLERTEVTNAWVNWIVDKRNWAWVMTLTFREEISQESAVKRWRRFLQVMNKDLLGNNYTRLVKHSYFSYCLGIERQLRNVIHFHVIGDRPIDFTMVHRVWKTWSGWAWISKINDRAGTVEYLTKYVLKGGEIMPYLADPPVFKLRSESDRPAWWPKNVI
jgi:hypothetical protein